MTRVVGALSVADLVSAAQEAADVLRAGGVVAVPTETVYGLAGDAFSPEACSRIFSVKERPLDDPLIVHVRTPDDLGRLTTGASAPLVQRLVAAFWPGPLTLVVPRRSEVPDLVTAGLPGVAVRCSSNAVLAAVLDAFGGPLAAPSANRFGRISPTTAAHVLEELGGRIPLVLDGGACTVGIESTIVAVDGEVLEILRPGPIGARELSEFARLAPQSATPAPGRMKSHYAPATPVRLVQSAEEVRDTERGDSAFLAWRAGQTDGFHAVEILSTSGDSVAAAARFYGALRRLDATGVRLIFAEIPPADGLGIAILDRLRKAAAHGEAST